MALSDEDVREILRIIDESDLTELQIQTDGFALHVVKGDRSLATATPAPPPPKSTASAPSPAVEPQNGHGTITAPMLGTFYRAEAPGKPPFVEVGARVEPDTIVCIIEVMKMMNSVTAGASGTIIRIFAENAQLVEYGEPLFEIGPA
jgi:acetyl-CoA carboxylase biotin carboxyl carrier protein